MSKLIFNPEKDMKELEKYNIKPRYDTYTGEIKMYTTPEVMKPLTKLYYVNNDLNRKPYWEFISDNSLLTYKLTKANLIIDEEELKDGIMD